MLGKGHQILIKMQLESGLTCRKLMILLCFMVYNSVIRHGRLGTVFQTVKNWENQRLLALPDVVYARYTWGGGKALLIHSFSGQGPLHTYLSGKGKSCREKRRAGRKGLTYLLSSFFRQWRCGNICTVWIQFTALEITPSCISTIPIHVRVQSSAQHASDHVTSGNLAWGLLRHK